MQIRFWSAPRNPCLRLRTRLSYSIHIIHAATGVYGDKAYDSQKVRQRIKDEGALPVVPSRSNAPQRKPTVQSGFTGAGTRSKITSAGSRIGGASQPDTTKLARNYLRAAAIIGAIVWIKL